MFELLSLLVNLWSLVESTISANGELTAFLLNPPLDNDAREELLEQNSSVMTRGNVTAQWHCCCNHTGNNRVSTARILRENI